MTTIIAQTVKLWFNKRRMDKEAIRSLTRISRSLWNDRQRSLSMSEDTLTSISLLQLSDERTLERASKAMIERAEKTPPKLMSLSHPFYRMAPLERFILTALHIEKWSYSRVSRILGIEHKLLEPLAWAIRIKFAYNEIKSEMEYPRGPTKLGAICPDYNTTEPWTQRMLDDELGKRERHFLQNHLMACVACRKSLDLTRRMFFKIEEHIPIKWVSDEIEESTEALYQTWKAGESAFRPIKTTFAESIQALFEQPKVQIACVLALMVYLISFFASK